MWPEGVPSSNGLSGAEQTLGPGLIGNVSVPVLYVYPASQPCGQAVILCPGGGFRGVAVEHEGRAFASWFNERGITLAVLKYRLPNGRREIPGEDIPPGGTPVGRAFRRVAHPVSGGDGGLHRRLCRGVGGPVPGDGNATGFSNPALSGYQYAGRADASSLARAVDGAAPLPG